MEWVLYTEISEMFFFLLGAYNGVVKCPFYDSEFLGSVQK